MTNELATPPKAEAAAKPAMPIMNVRLRPNRSARRPPSNSRPPKAREYPVTIHCRSLLEKARGLRLGQGDVDHGHVEHDHQLTQPAEGQDPPAPGIQRFRLGWHRRHLCAHATLLFLRSTA